MTTSISVTTIDGNEKQTTRSYGDVDPTKTNLELRRGIQGVLTLSGNSYVGGSRVIKVDLDDTYPEEATDNG